MLGGVKKTTDFLDKATWALVIGLFVLVIGMNLVSTDSDVVLEDTLINEQVQDAIRARDRAHLLEYPLSPEHAALQAQNP